MAHNRVSTAAASSLASFCQDRSGITVSVYSTVHIEDGYSVSPTTASKLDLMLVQILYVSVFLAVSNIPYNPYHWTGWILRADHCCLLHVS